MDDITKLSSEPRSARILRNIALSLAQPGSETRQFLIRSSPTPLSSASFAMKPPMIPVVKVLSKCSFTAKIAMSRSPTGKSNSAGMRSSNSAYLACGAHEASQKNATAARKGIKNLLRIINEKIKGYRFSRQRLCLKCI